MRGGVSMKTTKPFQYIDLEKAVKWKEELHPRSARGEFAKKNQGQAAAKTKPAAKGKDTGKTGVVKKDAKGKTSPKAPKKEAIQLDKKKTKKPVQPVQKASEAKKTTAKPIKKAPANTAPVKKPAPAIKAPVKAEPQKPAKASTKKPVAKKSTIKDDGAIKTFDELWAKRHPDEPIKQAKDYKNQARVSNKKSSEDKKLTPEEQIVKEREKAAASKPIPVPEAADKKASAKQMKVKKDAPETDVSPNSKEVMEKKTIEVPHGEKRVDPLESRQNQELKKYKEAGANSENTATIDKMWNGSEVQKLMAMEPKDRPEAKIKELAGNITTENDKLARFVTLQLGKAKGLNLLLQVNRIGDIGQSGNGEVINQETGYYGDLLQSARSTMYETLYRVMRGSQTPNGNTAVGAHVVTRMKQQLNSDIYDLMNSIPAPHEIRGAIADYKKAEGELPKTLGHTPSIEELANYLEEHSEAFKKAPIVGHPTYDEKTNQWVATKARIKDPAERLRALQLYTDQQKTSSMDENIGSEGEKEISRVDTARDEGLTPDEAYEKKERQKELETAIPKALSDMGLSDAEKEVFTTMFSSPSEKIHRGNMTLPEVVENINNRGGIGGKPIDLNTAYNLQRSGMKKIIQARTNSHPALEALKLLKSLFYNDLMKAIYQYDLVKSLNSFGVGVDILREKFTRAAYGINLLSLKKSLAPYEYIGSVVTTEDGGIHARIVELVLPEDNELYKSFNASMDSLKKSMFPHKGKSNHEVNQKAAEYVKANKERYTTLSGTQHSAAKAKGNLTWSEKLLVDNPGSAWITWGGKRILINVGDGKVIYDSANEVHREEQNQGAPEDKIDFQYEKDELEKEGLEDTPENRVKLDHGVKAFKEEMENMRKEWTQKDGQKIVGGLKKKVLDDNQHKTNDAYTSLTDEQRKEIDSSEDKAQALGKLMMEQNGDSIKQAIKDLKASGDIEAFKGKMAEIGKGKSNAMVTGKDTESLANNILKMKDPLSEDSLSKIAKDLGTKEIAKGRNASNKKMLPEGTFLVGNPITGKLMVVKFSQGMGEGNKKGWTSKIAEAFDPDGGNHEDLYSWGGLGRALEIKEASNIQEHLAQHANTEENMPFMKQISEEEYKKLRANTKLGLQETMKHNAFKLVNESRDRKGDIISSTYAMDMEDGTQNTVSVNKDGYIEDPVMARLLKQDKAIKNAEDLNEVMKNAVGNRAWVTAHFGNDIHIGDALGHHVQLEFDGKGAPRVIGGKYDGFRFMDTNDIPKGAIDPATGEPIRALFKNGKLVDRGFTTKNQVEMKAGNQVLYKDGDKFKKGRINAIEGDNYKITDGHGHVIGMFKKEDLKNASEEGRALSDSGQAVVRVGKTGTHRMDTEDTFKALDPKNQKKVDKVKSLFEEALKKADINDAFEKDGKLKDKLELSDAALKRLQSKLGRSKAGRELMKKFNSAYMKDLEIHVPESLRAQIEAEGVNVGANGTAKISAGKFEQLRDVLGGLSIDNNAREFLKEHFNRKDRRPKTMEELKKNYQIFSADEKSEFGKHYKDQFKKDSILNQEWIKNKDGSYKLDQNGNKIPGGIYSTQLEGVDHLITRGRGIVGHGMGTGKTITGVVAALNYKAQQLAEGKKPKKTLVVAPAGIQSEWGKEIGKHTNSKALYVGSEAKMRKKGADGNWMKSENGRHMFGQDGTEQEAVNSKAFLKNLETVGSEDHDFHIMSYDQFMKHRDALSKSGLYDNIIIDEIHAFKNQSGQRGKSLAETTDSFKNVWGLSGTPIENDAREMYSLVDTITGGRHELGSSKEFAENYLMKDKNGKIIGVKESKSKKLGDILANIVQFRGSSDVTYNDNSKIHFPHIIGQTSEDNPNPQHDFMANMVDRSRDHQSTDYYGTKHSVFDYAAGSHDVTGKDGSNYTVNTTAPKNLTPRQQEFYSDYSKMQSQVLPESKLKELVKAAASGFDSEKGSKDKSKNYLTAMQKLQKYLNAPQAKDMYVPGGASALDSDLTGAQAEGKAKQKAEGFKPYNPAAGEGHYTIDEMGYKRYLKSDGKGGYERNKDGTPVFLPPLHKNNPKAEYLKQRVSTYLDNLANENSRRRKEGKPELMPKVVVKSSYTTFGTDIVNNVLKDLEREHPHLAYWSDKLSKEGKSLSSGQFTGEAEDREATKTGFRGNKDDYAKDQGSLWATTVSPAGKEGVDFGNAHLMLMYDQDWNPQRMAQFTARVRRSDSAKSHEQLGRDNSVRIESLHMPGTIEDFMFNAEDSKMNAIQKVTERTKEAEKAPKFGDSEGRISSSKRFTRSQKRKIGAKPKNTKAAPDRPVGTGSDRITAVGKVAAEKSLKLVVLI
jgi:hypothetical protein